jgi:hypothetical protein
VSSTFRAHRWQIWIVISRNPRLDALSASNQKIISLVGEDQLFDVLLRRGVLRKPSRGPVVTRTPFAGERLLSAYL